MKNLDFGAERKKKPAPSPDEAAEAAPKQHERGSTKPPPPEKTAPSPDEAAEAACRNTNLKARNWFLTWNNFAEDEFKQLENWCKLNCENFVLGKEGLGEGKTPHIQGQLYFKNDRSFNALKKLWPKVHFEKTKNPMAANQYCKKEGKFVQKKSLEDQYNEFMEEDYKNVVWRPWQKSVLDLLETKPDRRKIHWFFEEKGNAGKSWLSRYIEWKYPTVIVNGKQGDVFCGIKTFLDVRQEYPKVVIIDIPRTNENYVCYSTMEKIKDCLFYSGKYEGGCVRLLPCHLIVFANFGPDVLKMSMDRWDIHEI